MSQPGVLLDVGEVETYTPLGHDVVVRVVDGQSQNAMTIIVEDETELVNVGSIEVECFEEESGAIMDKIMLVPPEDSDGSVEVRYLTRLEDDIVMEDDPDGFEGVLESLSFACLNSCGSSFEGPCSPCTGKSILRTRGDGTRNPGESPILSDRQVSFSLLEIHEFDMTLGNHPSAVSGPPVMLDWDRQMNERVVNVDEYERSRTPRRQRRQLKLSLKDRKGILYEGKGFTHEEVRRAWEEALMIRQQRKETLQRGTLLTLFDDVWESTCRKYNRTLEYLGIPL